MNPNTHLPLSASYRQVSLTLGKVAVALFVVLAHLQGNAGLLCVGTQSHGSNGYRGLRGALLRRGSGLVHHPTN